MNLLESILYVEGKDYEIYHSTLTSAMSAARKYAEDKGYTVDDDEWFRKVNSGPRKPVEGETNDYHIELLKDGKEQKKQLHVQVYGRGDRGNNSYELNCYVS